MDKYDENWIRKETQRIEKKKRKGYQKREKLRLGKFEAIERYLLENDWLKTQIPFGLGFQKDNIIFIFNHATGIMEDDYGQFTALKVYLTPDTKVPENIQSKYLKAGSKKSYFNHTRSGFWVREYDIKEPNVLNAFEYRFPLNGNESWKQVLENKEMEIKQLLKPSS